MFDQLTELAFDRSPERRAELLLALTDLFASAGCGADATTTEIYAEIAEHLLPEIGAAGRSEFAFRIAGIPTAPRALVLRLAMGPIELAEPVLRLSPVLSEADLIELAAELPEPHLEAIALRRPLPESVTEALVRRGGAAVLSVIAGNRAARLSAAGLSQLVAGTSGALPADRGEGPARILPFPAAADRPRRARRGEGSSTVHALPRRTREAPVASVIAAIAPHDRMLEVAMLLAEHAGLPADLVSRLIARPDPTLLAVLCRVAGVSEATFSVIARIRGGRFGHTVERIARVEAVYAQLSTAEAQQALQYIRARHATRGSASGG